MRLFDKRNMSILTIVRLRIVSPAALKSFLHGIRHCCVCVDGYTSNTDITAAVSCDADTSSAEVSAKKLNNILSDILIGTNPVKVNYIFKLFKKD